MQTLSTLLRKLAVITQCIAAMQNQQVAYFLASKLKQASSFVSDDYVDIADICDDYAAMTDNFCPEDIQRLNAISKACHDALTALHAVQDSLIQNPAA